MPLQTYTTRHALFHIGMVAMTSALLFAMPAGAQTATYTTPTGTPDGKLHVIVPEGTTVQPVYVSPAQQDTVTGPQELYNPQNIRFLSGGVGADEQALIKAAEADYPVKITFASDGGAYFSDVQVDVKDSKGTDVLSLITDGPILLLDLKPGTYTLTASNGREVKELTLKPQNKAALAVRFAAQ